MRMESGKSVINLGVLCLVQDETIAKYLIPLLKSCATKPEFIRLLPADLRSYIPPSHLDAVILVHPYTEGRLSLTDVTDARYSTLLPTLKEHFGPKRICVIAYLVRNVKEHTQQTHLDLLKSMQPTVNLNSDYIIICGNLNEMFSRDLDEIKQFMKISWKTTTRRRWEDKWFLKPFQTPTTEETANHTQHGEHDPSKTTDDDSKDKLVPRDSSEDNKAHDQDGDGSKDKLVPRDSSEDNKAHDQDGDGSKDKLVSRDSSEDNKAHDQDGDGSKDKLVPRDSSEDNKAHDQDGDDSMDKLVHRDPSADKKAHDQVGEYGGHNRPGFFNYIIGTLRRLYENRNEIMNSIRRFLRL